MLPWKHCHRNSWNINIYTLTHIYTLMHIYVYTHMQTHAHTDTIHRVYQRHVLITQIEFGHGKEMDL